MRTYQDLVEYKREPWLFCEPVDNIIKGYILIRNNKNRLLVHRKKLKPYNAG